MSVAALVAIASLVGACANDTASIETQDQATDGSATSEPTPEATVTTDPTTTATTAGSTTLAPTDSGSEPESQSATVDGGEGPEMSIDHWHNAYLIHQCGIDLPAAEGHDSPDGIHTHGDGLIHIHPFTPAGAGSNATIGKFVEELGGLLTDDSYIRASAAQPVTLSEGDGCDGEEATLQLAFWEDANSTDPPVIITEDIAGHRFRVEGSAYTLALLPAGAEIPKPPADRLANLAQVVRS